MCVVSVDPFNLFLFLTIVYLISLSPSPFLPSFFSLGILKYFFFNFRFLKFTVFQFFCSPQLLLYINSQSI